MDKKHMNVDEIIRNANILTKPQYADVTESRGVVHTTRHEIEYMDAVEYFKYKKYKDQ